jgi:hypothetical protein
MSTVEQRFELSSPVNNTTDDAAIADHSSFSPAQFMAGVNESLTNPNLSVASTITYEVRFDSKRQFRADEFNGPVTIKKISFVPSRGPKFPW